MEMISGLIAFCAFMVTSMSVSASEIRVMSGGAPKEVFVQLTPKFEQQTGNKVVFVYDVLTALREKLAAGEKADVLVMPYRCSIAMPRTANCATTAARRSASSAQVWS